MTNEPIQPPSPFDEALGARVEEVGEDRVVVSLPVAQHLHQAWGIVHGGAYCALTELAASLGANACLADGRVAAGVSNHTDFLRPVPSGVLRAEAVPLQRGRTQQLWEVRITDEDGRLAAQGCVRLANIDATEARASSRAGTAPRAG